MIEFIGSKVLFVLWLVAMMVVQPSDCRLGIFNGNLHVARTPANISPRNSYAPVVINYSPRHYFHTSAPPMARRSSSLDSPLRRMSGILARFVGASRRQDLLRARGIAAPLASASKPSPALMLQVESLLTQLLSYLPIDQRVKIRNLITKGRVERMKLEASLNQRLRTPPGPAVIRPVLGLKPLL